MTTETTEAHNVTSLPPAPKQRKLHNPFAKKADETADTTEQTPTKGKKLHGAYAVGVALLVAGGVAAVASRFGKSGDDESTETSSDTPTTDN